MRLILTTITDKHGGHVAGLMNPETVLYRKEEYEGDEYENGGYDLVEYTPEITPSKLRRWKLYERIIEETIDLARGDPIVLFDLGDQTQGTYYTDDLESNLLADHIVIAKWNLVPWMRIPNLIEIRLAVGTGWHDFGEGSATQIVARMLKGEFPDKSIVPLYHGLTEFRDTMDVQGLKIDYTHHGPGQSMRKWLEGNTARYYLKSLMWDEIGDGNIPPQLVLRGHYHSLINETFTIYAKKRYFESRLVVVPPLCGMGDFARKITRSAHKVTEGGAIFEIIDDKLLPPVFITETRDIRKKETLCLTEKSTKP